MTMTEAQWLASTDPREMLRFLEGKVSKRQLRLFACGCAENAGYSDWRTWSDKTDISPGEFLPQEGAAYWVGLKVGQHHALRLTREEKVLRAALLRDIADNPFRPWVDYACCHACRCWFQPDKPRHYHCPRCDGKSFERHRIPPWWLTWQDSTPRRLAEAIYDEQAFDRMPILADALQEAGCDNEALLRHCRGWERCPECGGRSGGEQVYCQRSPNCTGWIALRGPHVRGCHVIDLLLGLS